MNGVLWIALAAAMPLQIPETELHVPAPGAAVAGFTLPDIHRRPRSLTDYAAKRAVVVVFIGTECPLANLYFPTLVALHREYAEKGVQILAVNSNAHDSFASVSAHAQERQAPFPVLKDFDQRVADAFGATRTPEAFVLDSQHAIRYHGPVDDQYGIGYQREAPRERYLQQALDDLLAERPVTTLEIEVSGCLIARRKTPQGAADITYSGQIASLMQRRCQECHRPGEIGPFSLLTYEDARNWGENIREAVLQERMPPWHADSHFGKFANERRLSQEESEVLLAWIDQDCPLGDIAQLPPPREFPQGWQIGVPGAVFQMPEEFEVPASGVLPYKRFTMDPGFDKDVWVQAAECRPGNRAVVHHILVYIQAPGEEIYQADGTAATLVGWAPGDMPAQYTPGTAKRIPAGSTFVFEVHYTPNGVAQRDRSSVGIVFASGPPEREAETNILANMALRIPAGAAEHEGRMSYTFRDDALLLSFMPHMHLRGASARYEATWPDGRTETLLSVPDYDFNWQSVYRFAAPLHIPRGTTLNWIGRWDNSADNPRNPDPTQEVRWGLQTWDEMQNGWMEVVWIAKNAGG